MNINVVNIKGWGLEYCHIRSSSPLGTPARRRRHPGPRYGHSKALAQQGVQHWRKCGLRAHPMIWFGLRLKSLVFYPPPNKLVTTYK